MNFHLDFQIPAFPKTIQYTDPLFFIGSCFAENIAAKMHGHKFNTLLNPHGILYNPESIAQALRRYMRNELFSEQDLFSANGCFHSWEHHSCFSNTSAGACVSNINQAITLAHQTLQKAGWLFITLGTAYVYRHEKSGKRVGNCHKQPSQQFTKELLTVAEMQNTYQALITGLQAFNKELRIIFTISPVRYIRDGVVENNRSKARLMELVHLLNDGKNVLYFPAYELVIDDLRDYRFYKADLVHPNEQAMEYVFEKFTQVALDAPAKQLLEKIKDIGRARSHKAFQEQSPDHQKFRSTYYERCIQLQQAYPFLQLQEELTYFG